MGKRPVQIEHEIAEQRELIERRVREMRDRGSRDAEELTSRIGDAFTGTAVRQTVDERPILTVAGALALGVALGMASESVSLRGLLSQGEKSYRNAPSANGGILGSLSAVAVDELKDILERWATDRRCSAEEPDQVGRHI
jgi:ElaB/YqjD/DUF883 family membrane-anchored ribosome-binding protein